MATNRCEKCERDFGQCDACANEPEPEYDESTCVTAGELRAGGFPLPSDIPDCAWVPRAAMRLGAATPTRLDGDTLHATIDLEFFAPFRWKTRVEIAP